MNAKLRKFIRHELETILNEEIIVNQEYYQSHNEDSDFITYEIYCEAINQLLLNENVFTQAKQGVKNLTNTLIEKAKAVLGPIVNYITTIANNFKIGFGMVVEAFKQKSVFAFLKAIKFNLNTIIQGMKGLTGLVREGLLGVFKKLADTKAIQSLRNGAIKVDQFLNQYPILKKISGPMVGCLLIWIWLNMSFIGDAEFDLNVTHMISAFAGQFTLADLFLSPSGLAMLTLLATGPYLSFPWLAAAPYNIILALFYSGYKHFKEKNPQVLNSIKSMVG